MILGKFYDNASVQKKFKMDMELLNRLEGIIQADSSENPGFDSNANETKTSSAQSPRNQSMETYSSILSSLPKLSPNKGSVSKSQEITTTNQDNDFSDIMSESLAFSSINTDINPISNGKILESNTDLTKIMSESLEFMSSAYGETGKAVEHKNPPMIPVPVPSPPQISWESIQREPVIYAFHNVLSDSRHGQGQPVIDEDSLESYSKKHFIETSTKPSRCASSDKPASSIFSAIKYLQNPAEREDNAVLQQEGVVMSGSRKRRRNRRRPNQNTTTNTSEADAGLNNISNTLGRIETITNSCLNTVSISEEKNLTLSDEVDVSVETNVAESNVAVSNTDATKSLIVPRQVIIGDERVEFLKFDENMGICSAENMSLKTCLSYGWKQLSRGIRTVILFPFHHELVEDKGKYSIVVPSFKNKQIITDTDDILNTWKKKYPNLNIVFIMPFPVCFETLNSYKSSLAADPLTKVETDILNNCSKFSSQFIESIDELREALTEMSSKPLVIDISKYMDLQFTHDGFNLTGESYAEAADLVGRLLKKMLPKGKCFHNLINLKLQQWLITKVLL